MAQAQLKEELIPSGGIADFVMSDAEIAALEAEEVRDQFGDSGIARFEPIAKRMASYGRYGDDQVVHAETGELLVPRALIEQSPELKESIFNHLREMGVEDPDRYVVGSGANSINPDTGLPEFFFKAIRRAVSKVAKGVSKAVSKVGKVLKKVAPIALTIAGTAAFGPMYGAAFGSGIGTLIQGGDLKDALKASLKAGVIGGVTAGIGSKMSGGTFTEGFSNAADLGNVSAGFESVGKAATGDFSGFSMKNMSQGPTAEGGTAYQAPSAEATVTEKLAGATDVTPAQQVAADTSFTPDTSGTTSIPLDAPPLSQTLPDYKTVGNLDNLGATETSFFDTAKGYASDAGDYLFRGGKSAQDVALAQDAAEQAYLAKAARTSIAPTEAGLAAARSAAGPGYIARFGPSIALAGAGAAAAGFFDAAPQEDPNLVDRRTGADLLAENEDQYMIGGRTPQYATGPTRVGTQYGYNPVPRIPPFMRNPFVRPQMYAADGGEVYPRRNGGIMPNEGVPGKDSVRALLMPGEFVMTTDAVKGLGNGSMNQGINNMYSMMRNLESRGRTV